MSDAVFKNRLLQVWPRLVAIVVALVFVLSAASKLLQHASLPDSTIFSSVFQSAWSQRLFACTEIALAFWLLVERRGVFARITVVIVLSAMASLLIREARSAHPKGCGCSSSAVQTDQGPSAVKSDLTWSAVRNVCFIAAVFSTLPFRREL